MNTLIIKIIIFLFIFLIIINLYNNKDNYENINIDIVNQLSDYYRKAI